MIKAKLYPTIKKKNGDKIKYKEVIYSTAEDYSENIDSRSENFHSRIATYILMLQIRDVLYIGKNKYHLYARRKAIYWFKSKNDRHPFGFGMVCMVLGINAEKLWLQLKRWLKVNPVYITSSLKSAESGIFDGPKFSSLRREGLRRDNNVGSGVGHKNKS